MRKTKTGMDTSIIDGILYMDGFEQSELDTEVFTQTIGDGYTKAIRLISLRSNWTERNWVEGIGMQTEMIDFEMTLRREVRSGKGHWYAYRRVFGKLNKRYVGTDEDVTTQRLVEIAHKMPTKKLGAVKK